MASTGRSAHPKDLSLLLTGQVVLHSVGYPGPTGGMDVGLVLVVGEPRLLWVAPQWSAEPPPAPHAAPITGGGLSWGLRPPH